MFDKRFYMVSGSRWRFKVDFDVYPAGTEFDLVQFGHGDRVLVINCPEYPDHFIRPSHRVNHARSGVTGTLSYSEVRNSIELIEAGRGKVYFIRMDSGGMPRSSFMEVSGRAQTKDSFNAATYPTFMSAWTGLLRAAGWGSRHYDPDPYCVYGFDPVTEAEYEIDLPRWKHQSLRWFATTLAFRHGVNHANFVNLIIKAEKPFIVGEVCSADFRDAKSFEQPVFGQYVLFDNEEVAIEAKLRASFEVQLFPIHT